MVISGTSRVAQVKAKKILSRTLSNCDDVIGSKKQLQSKGAGRRDVWCRQGPHTKLEARASPEEWQITSDDKRWRD